MLEALDIQFKESIKYGMSYNQFWFDDPQLYYIYEEAYLEKLKERDIFNWQMGVYMQYAIGSCLAKECKYPTSPIFSAKEKKKQLTMLEKFEIMMAQVNKNFE